MAALEGTQSFTAQPPADEHRSMARWLHVYNANKLQAPFGGQTELVYFPKLPTKRISILVIKKRLLKLQNLLIKER